jgi:threonine/homoserine/homoserine lactone efflux protein
VTAIQTTLTGGRRAGIAIGCGLGLVAASWTMAALLGLDFVFTAFPWAYSTAKLVGAVYLLYLAYKMWRGARNSVASGREFHARLAFTRGLLVNLLNPKSVLFAAAVLIVVFPADMSMTENVLVFANHLAVELVFYAALAFAVSSRAVSSRYLRAKLVLDRVAAVVLGSLGLRLFISR